MRRGAKIALIVVAGLGVLAGGIVVLLANPQATTRLGHYALERLDQQIPADVAFERLAINPATGRVTIDDLRVTLPNAPQEKLLSARQAVIDLDLAALLSGRVRLQSVHLTAPEATIIHRGGNRYNMQELLPKSKAPKQEGTGFFSLDRLVIEDGHVTYLDAPRHLEAELPDIAADLTLDLQKQDVSGMLTLAGGWVKVEDVREPLTGVEAKFRYAEGDLRLDRLRLDAAGSTLAVSGTARGLTKKTPARLDLDGLLRGRLDPWSELAGMPLAGTVRADFQLRGTPEAPEASVALVGQGLRVKDLRVAHLESRLQATKTALVVKSLAAKALGGTLTAAGTVPLDRAGRLSARAEVHGVSLAAIADQLEVKALQGAAGALSAEVEAHGPRLDPEAIAATGRLAVDGRVPVKGERVALTGHTRFAWRTGTLKLSDLDVRALGGTLRGTAQVSPLATVPTYGAEATLTGLSAQALAPFVDRPLPVTGTVQASLSLTGRGFKAPRLSGHARLSAKGALKARQAGNPEPLPFDVDSRLAFEGRTVRLSALTAHGLGGTLTASGRVGLGGAQPTYTLDTALSGVDLAAVRRTFGRLDVPLTGQANAKLAVHGTGSRFVVSGPVSVAGTARVPTGVAGASETLPLAVSGQVAVTPDSVRLTPLTARLGESTVTAQGQIDLNGRSDLNFMGQIADAPALARLFGIEAVQGGAATFSGTAQGTGGTLRFSAQADMGQIAVDGKASLGAASLRLHGTLAQRLTVEGTVSGRDVQVGEQRIQALASPFRYAAPRTAPARGTLELPALTATVNRGRVAGSARLDLGAKRYTVDLASTGLTLGDLGPLASTEGVPAETPVTLVVRGQGALSAPALTAKVAIAPFSYQGQALGATSLDAELVQGELKVEGQIFDEQFQVSGRVPTAPGRPAELTLNFERAELGPLFAMLPDSLESKVELPVEGRLTGKVHLVGPLDAPERVKAEVDLSTLRVAYRDLLLENRGPIRLTYADRALRVRRFHLVGQETDLRASGTIGLGVPSDLSLNGRINLALLEKVAPRTFAEAAGTAQIEAQLAGTLGSPDVTGALTVREGELTARALPQAVSNLNGAIRLVENRVFLDDLSADLGYTGHVQAFGGATLGTDLMPEHVSLQVSANEIELALPDVRVLANADLSFTGTPDASRLDGDVRVLEGAVTRDIDLTQRLLEARPGGPAGPPEWADEPFVRNLSLRTHVLVPGQFFIKNNLADVELRGDLVVLGTPTHPVAVGRVETIGGTVTFQDVTYDLQEASVDLIDPHKLTPYLHVLAGAQLQGFDVQVQVNGQPDALRVDLNSTPFLPQSDVLILLATGQVPQSGEGAEGLSFAGNLLLNQVTRGVERGVAQQGVVDVLRIQPRSQSPTEVGGGSFTVGKRLSDRLMITYTQDIALTPGETPGRLVIFDYNLTDHIVLKLEQDLGGGFDASARYRIPVR